jgi:hypothetical protein
MRRSLIACATACLLLACGPDEAFTANFTITCTLADGAGKPLDQRVMRFVSYKMDYDDNGLKSTMFDLNEDTRLQESGPAIADFTVGYTLHQRGEQEERASFRCSYGPGSGGLYAQETTSVTFSQAKAEGGYVLRTLNLVAY